MSEASTDEVVPAEVAKAKINPQIGSAMIGGLATLAAAVIGIMKCNATSAEAVADFKKLSPVERVMSLYREGADLYLDKSYELARIKLESAVLEAKQSRVVAPEPLGLLGVIQFGKASADRSNSLDYEAWRNVKKAIDDGCQLPKVRRIYAQMLLRNNDRLSAMDAEEQYTLAQQVEPSSVFEYEGLGEAQRRLDKLDLAQANFEKAISLDPNFSLAYIGLGKVHYMRGQDSEAIAKFKLAIEISDRMGHTDWRINLSRDSELADLRQNPDFLAAIEPPTNSLGSSPPNGGSGF